jgi:hypothetical protein
VNWYEVESADVLQQLATSESGLGEE